MDNLTVCITSFKRAKYRNRALFSCEDAGVKNVVISEMGADQNVESFCQTRRPFHSLTVDLGCHALWLQAVYRAQTARVIVLHDDDLLAREFGGTYRNEIAPMLNSEVGFASWRAALYYDDGRTHPCEYFHGETRVLPSSELAAIVSHKGRLSLSPVVSVFNREVLLHALKDSEGALPWLRPGMPLGTEIVVYLRHCQRFKKWLYVNKVLSFYGAHDGSGTVKAEQAKTLKPLTDGYDAARLHCFRNTNYLRHAPRCLLVSCPHGNESKKELDAQKTWLFQMELGRMLNFPFHSERSSEQIGDARGMAYLRDVLDYGAEYALSEDVIVYSNRDLAFTIDLPQRLIRGIANGGGVCIAWRRTMEYNPNQHFESVKQGKLDGGVDLIAVSPHWWKTHRQRIPDFFLGGNFWDYCFRIYAERVCGKGVYIDDGTYHAPHPSMFSRVGLDNPVQQHNLALARDFFRGLGMNKTAATLEASCA